MINSVNNSRSSSYNAPSGGNQIDAFLANAMKFEGQNYVWGGGHGGKTGVQGVDCSGLVTQAMKMAGINIGGTARDLQKKGTAVKPDLANLKPGDLVFKGNPAHHVGIYLGNGKVLEAKGRGTKVKVTDLQGGGWTSARRVLNGQATTNPGMQRSVNDAPWATPNLYKVRGNNSPSSLMLA